MVGSEAAVEVAEAAVAEGMAVVEGVEEDLIIAIVVTRAPTRELLNSIVFDLINRSHRCKRPRWRLGRAGRRSCHSVGDFIVCCSRSLIMQNGCMIVSRNPLFTVILQRDRRRIPPGAGFFLVYALNRKRKKEQEMSADRVTGQIEPIVQVCKRLHSNEKVPPKKFFLAKLRPIFIYPTSYTDHVPAKARRRPWSKRRCQMQPRQFW